MNVNWTIFFGTYKVGYVTDIPFCYGLVYVECTQADNINQWDAFLHSSREHSHISLVKDRGKIPKTNWRQSFSFLGAKLNYCLYSILGSSDRKVRPMLPMLITMKQINKNSKRLIKVNIIFKSSNFILKQNSKIELSSHISTSIHHHAEAEETRASKGI